MVFPYHSALFQESSNDISTRSPPEISLAKSLQSAHVTTDDVTVAHDVTISDEVTRSEMGLASARDSSNQEESSRVPTSECTSPDVIPRLKQRKSAAFVGSTLEMLEASSLEDVNEQSCDLAALGFVDCVPSVPKRAKPVEVSTPSFMTFKLEVSKILAPLSRSCN